MKPNNSSAPKTPIPSHDPRHISWNDDLLRQAAMRFPNAIAFETTEQQWSYAEADRIVDKLVLWLRDTHRLLHKTPIAYWGPKQPETLFLYHAILRLGALLTPLQPRFPSSQVAQLCKDIGCSTIFVDANMQENVPDSLRPIALDDVTPFLTSSPRMTLTTTSENTDPSEPFAKINKQKPPPSFALPTSFPNAQTHISTPPAQPSSTLSPQPTVRNSQTHTFAPPAFPSPLPRKNLSSPTTPSQPTTWDAQQPATCIFTSGSTGNPKAAIHSYANHVWNALGAAAHISFVEGDRWWLSLPLFHVGGLALLFRAALHGGTLVLPSTNSSNHHEFPPNLTHFSMVPTQLHRLFQQPQALSLLTSTKAILLGGGIIPPALLQQAQKHHLPIFTTYGLTEMGSQVTTSRPQATFSTGIHAGSLLPHRELQIREDREIWVRGPSCFLGYLQDGTITPATQEDGWLPTGDLGSWDRQQQLVFLGRKDNMFVSGGENIHPEEIELHLARWEEVEQSLVIDIPDKEYGARPIAWIRWATEKKLPDTEIRTRLQRVLPKFKIPDAFLPWPQDPCFQGLKPKRPHFRKEAQRYAQTHQASPTQETTHPIPSIR